jgi:putative salt-induced outer membrane protein YdiY
MRVIPEQAVVGGLETPGNRSEQFGSSPRTAQQVLGTTRVDFLRTSRLFSFAQVNLEHDVLEELVLRAQEQAGVGYKLILTPRTLLQGVVGVGFQEELFEEEEAAVEPLGRLGIEWTQRLGQTSEFAGQVAFLPDLINLGEYRPEGEVSLRTPITHHFHLRLSLTDTFNSAPQPGVEQNDLTLLSSVVWGF